MADGSNWRTYGGKRFIDATLTSYEVMREDRKVSHRINKLVDTLEKDFYIDGVLPSNNRKSIMAYIDESLKCIYRIMSHWELDSGEEDGDEMLWDAAEVTFLNRPYTIQNPAIGSHGGPPPQGGPEVRMVYRDGGERVEGLDLPVSISEYKWRNYMRMIIPHGAEIPLSDNIAQIEKKGNSVSFSELLSQYDFREVLRYVGDCRLEDVEKEWLDKWETYGWRFLNYNDPQYEKKCRKAFRSFRDDAQKAIGKDYPTTWDEMMKVKKSMGDWTMFDWAMRQVIGTDMEWTSWHKKTQGVAMSLATNLDADEDANVTWGKSAIGMTDYEDAGKVGRTITIQTHENGQKEIIRALYSINLPVSSVPNEKARFERVYWKWFAQALKDGRETLTKKEYREMGLSGGRSGTLQLSLYVLNGFGDQEWGGKQNTLMVYAIPQYTDSDYSISHNASKLFNEDGELITTKDDGEVVLTWEAMSWILNPQLTEEIFAISDFNAKTFVMVGDYRDWGLINNQFFKGDNNKETHTLKKTKKAETCAAETYSAEILISPYWNPYSPEEVYEIASASQMRGPQSWDYQHYENPDDDSLLGSIMRTPEWELIRFDEKVLREKPITHAEIWIGKGEWPEPIVSNTPIVIQNGGVIDGNHRLASALTWGEGVLAFVPKGVVWWNDELDDDEMKEWNDDLDELLGSSKQKCDCLPSWCFCWAMGAETYSAEGKPPKQAKGLVVDDPKMAALIRKGEKTMVVWNKPLNIAKKRFIILSNRKAYAYIEVGAMEEITLPKFRKLENQHRISGSERSRLWKGHKRLYAWPVKVLKKFDRLYSTNAPLRPRKVVPRVKTYSAETKMDKPMNAAQRAIYRAVLGAKYRESLKKQEIMRKMKELQQELESAMRNSVRVF